MTKSRILSALADEYNNEKPWLTTHQSTTARDLLWAIDSEVSDENDGFLTQKNAHNGRT